MTVMLMKTDFSRSVFRLLLNYGLLLALSALEQVSNHRTYTVQEE